MKGNLVLTLCMKNLGLTATSSYETWMPAWKGVRREAKGRAEHDTFNTALTLALIFKLLAPGVFENFGSSADAELVEGVWPNQEPLSLSARFFFFA